MAYKLGGGGGSFSKRGKPSRGVFPDKKTVPRKKTPLTKAKIEKLVYTWIGKKLSNKPIPQTAIPKTKKLTDKQMKKIVKTWTGKDI